AVGLGPCKGACCPRCATASTGLHVRKAAASADECHTSPQRQKSYRRLWICVLSLRLSLSQKHESHGSAENPTDKSKIRVNPRDPWLMFYTAGCGFSSGVTADHPPGFSAWFTAYATTPAAIRIMPKANELMPRIDSCSLRTTEKHSKSAGGMPIAIAPNQPPGTRKGRASCGSR